MNQIQERLLKMFKWLHNYCVENGIKYYAVGGTMLGAARHKGFIPWDDDIDIVVPREDYVRLLEIFKEPVDGYFLESPYSGNEDYLYSYAKLYDINTTLVENTRIKCKRGLFIDIFPLDAIGNTFEEANKNFGIFDKKNMFLMTRTCSINKNRSFYKNLAIVFARLIPSFIVNNKKLSIEVDKIAADINMGSSVYVAPMMGTYRFKEIVKGELFGEPVLYKFEDFEVYGPERYDEYLTKVYGDWRALPPEEKRKSNHDFIEFDLNKPYM